MEKETEKKEKKIKKAGKKGESTKLTKSEKKEKKKLKKEIKKMMKKVEGKKGKGGSGGGGKKGCPKCKKKGGKGGKKGGAGGGGGGNAGGGGGKGGDALYNFFKRSGQRITNAEFGFHRSKMKNFKGGRYAKKPKGEAVAAEEADGDQDTDWTDFGNRRNLEVEGERGLSGTFSDGRQKAMKYMKKQLKTMEKE